MDETLADGLVDAYLDRLGVAGRPSPEARTLGLLVERHLQAVPFENLDVFDRRPIALGTERAVRKIVERRRGGFCFELNEAFRGLLAALGFAVRRIEARVWVEAERRFGPPFDHLALVVSLGGRDVLVDVGFGDNNRQPMRLPSDEAADVSGRYRLDTRPDGLAVLARLEPVTYARPLYEMTLAPRALSAFAEMCAFHQTSPASIFTRGLVCTLPLPHGRATLTDTKFIEMEGGHRREHAVTETAQRRRILQERFGAGHP